MLVVHHENILLTFISIVRTRQKKKGKYTLSTTTTNNNLVLQLLILVAILPFSIGLLYARFVCFSREEIVS